MSEPTQSFERWLHDVRNQLSIILGFSEILLQELDGKDSKRPDIQEIHTAAQRAMAVLARTPRRQEDSSR